MIITTVLELDEAKEGDTIDLRALREALFEAKRRRDDPTTIRGRDLLEAQPVRGTEPGLKSKGEALD